MFKVKEMWDIYHPKALEEHRKLAELIAKSNLGFNMLHNDGMMEYIIDIVYPPGSFSQTRWFQPFSLVLKST